MVVIMQYAHGPCLHRLSISQGVDDKVCPEEQRLVTFPAGLLCSTAYLLRPAHLPLRLHNGLHKSKQQRDLMLQTVSIEKSSNSVSL